MELRFLKGSWEFGKFKLQYREWIAQPINIQNAPFWTDWFDVPIAEDKPKEKNSLEELATRFHTAYHFSINREEMGKFRHLAQIAEEYFKKGVN